MNSVLSILKTRTMHSIWSNKWFWVILSIKLVAASLFASSYMRELFVPFVTQFIDSGFSNPWEAFAQQGKLDAFPYSGIMLLLLSAPQTIMTAIASSLVHSSEHLRIFLIHLPMLFADLTIFIILVHWFQTKTDKVVWLYWASPILFFITYIHGQIDSIPSAFLFISLFFLFRKNAFCSGIALGLGIASKLHLLAAIPFLIVYLFKKTVRDDAWKTQMAGLLTGIIIPTLIGVVPFLFSSGYRTMVIGAPEIGRLFDIAIQIRDGLWFYIAPAAILLLLLRFLAAPKINRDLTILFLAMLYSVLVLLVPPMPGWYFWSIPLACYFFVRQEEITGFSYWLVNSLYIIYFLFFWKSTGTSQLIVFGVSLSSIFFTGLQTSLALMIFWIYRIGIRSNSQYKLRTSPVMIGIGGDSGAGKDTITRVFRDLLGQGTSVQTNGDDYHRWTREDKAWESKTHLDPKANKMFLPIQHAKRLKSGKPIVKQTYDHSTGKFTDPIRVRPKPYTFFVGLHPFYIKQMRSLLDLKIFIEPTDDLRTYWKLKRDKEERGHDYSAILEQIKNRNTDSKIHIQPQKEYADWIIQYKPAPSTTHLTLDQTPALSVQHILKNDLDIEDMVEQLGKINTIDLRWDFDPGLEKQSIEATGRIEPETVKQIAFQLYPNLHELTGSENIHWRSDLDGISQLLFISHINSYFETSEGVH